jgi:long-chain acyl-CoA synthetase
VGTTNAREFGQDDLLFPLNHVQLQVKEVPDIFTQPSNEETNGGELYVKGPSVMKAYFNNETATKETFDDEGWLKTGDVVKMFKNGSFKIIDRTKNIFKLAQGVYIAPE